MTARHVVLGIFAKPAAAVAAVRELRDRGFGDLETFSPVPVEELLAELPRKPPVRHFTLWGGLAGLATGLLLTSLTSLIYNLVVGGKPPIAIVPYLIVSFELTILLGGLCTLAGLLIGARLPRRKEPRLWDPRLSEDRYGVSVNCNPEALDLLSRILAEHGAEDVRRA
ncbi:MAG: DUF3341 domain-containing protein [Deltaproteobacteria bacterium]|nr:DUF3341 domain-containing protein [Deltaproteobacteria bacterium]